MAISVGDMVEVVGCCPCSRGATSLGRIGMVLSIVTPPSSPWGFGCTSCGTRYTIGLMAHTSFNQPDCYTPLAWLKKINPPLKEDKRRVDVGELSQV